MFDQIWPFIQEQLQHNQFMSGGFILMILGAVAAYCRALPSKAWNWITQRLFLEFEIPAKDAAFNWFNDWLAIQTYSKKRARWLTVRTYYGSKGWQIILSPAPGQHWMFWRGRLMIVRRSRKEPQQVPGLMGVNTEPSENFVVSLLTWQRQDINQLLEECRKETEIPDDEENEIEVFCANWDCWNNGNTRRKRPASSVVLDDGVMETLLADVKRFKESETWYVDRGIPYRRGYLLHGPPGSGKSSTVLAIASELSMDIYILNLNLKIDDDKLNRLLCSLPPECIVLIEDIDCVWQQRKSDETAITFSGLLNAIDGVAATEGRLLFLTTNHRDKLDPALIRPGRADVHYLIDDATDSQAARIFKRFFPETKREAEFGKRFGGKKHSMATLQGLLLNATEEDALAAAL